MIDEVTKTKTLVKENRLSIYKEFHMENKYDDANVTLVKDLKVTVQRFSKVFPTNKWERQMFVSNIDLAANFNTGVIHFFPPNIKFPIDSVIEKIENTLQDVLVKYDYLAGRLRREPHTNRLVIVCNAGWLGFAVASSELCLAEVGDLAHPNPAFGQLRLALDDISSPDDQPLCAFQVTSFKCGGFAMGYSANHMLSDGIGLRVFFENVASLLAGKPLPFPPYNNRRALAARTPPRVKFSHHELTKVSIPEGDKTIYMKIFQNMDENIDNKIFHLSSDDILKLKKEAEMSNVEGRGIITSFNVVMSHLWRCRGLSENDPEKKTSTILYAVDLRSRLQPPLPLTYAGNAIISAYATASISELKEKPLGYLVQLISQGTTRITNEYARSHIDWLELHTGFPHGDFYVSPWWKIGLADVDYPWGRPKYCTPVLHFRKQLILLLPNSDGLNVLVALPHDEMEKFQYLFRRLDSFPISQSRL